MNTESEQVSEISPLDLRDEDHLGLELAHDREDRRIFLMRARSLTRDPLRRMPGSQDRFFIRGEEHYEFWDGPSVSATSFFNRLVERAWDKKRERWVVAATDANAIITLRSWPMDRLVFANDETRREFQRLVYEFSVGETIALQAARFKLDGTVPPLPEFWQERKDAPLSPYQRTAVRLSLDVPGFALFMDRGTGKTACAIQQINILAQMMNRGELEGGIRRKDGGKMLLALVVVPKNVRLNWQREFEKFSHVRGKITVLRGGLSRRIRAIAEARRPENDCFFSVLIAGYDAIRTTSQYLSMAPWDVLQTDESHAYKDPETDRFKALIKLRPVTGRRLSLTGTPIGNSPMDLWSQLEFLREGGSGFTSKKAFKMFHGVWEAVKTATHGVAKLIGLQNIPLLQERLARMSFSVSKEEAGLHLPDKVRSIIEVEMTAYQREVYNKLQDELALEIEDKLSGDIVDEVTVKNILTQLLRLAQVTSGYITYDAKVDPDTGNVIVPKRVAELSPTNPKVDAALELLTDPERDPRGKTIIWCHFIPNIHRISEALTAAGIKHGCYYGDVSDKDRDAIVDAFNCDPEFKVIVGNPQTAGEGLNLLGYDTRDPGKSDTFCDMEIFVSSGWSAILRAQAEDRAHRRGTRMPVQIIDLIVPGTIDEEIIARVTEKREMAETVTDLRTTLSRVLGKEREDQE